MASGSTQYFRYTDDSGAVVITNGLDAVPKRYRDDAEPLQMSEAEARSFFDVSPIKERAKDLLDTARQQAGAQADLARLHPPSVVLGFGLGLAVFLVFSLVFRTGKFMFRLVLFLVVIGLIGLSTAWVAHTGRQVSKQLIEDAKKAAAEFEAKMPKVE